MANGKYILIVALILIGATVSFGYWALDEFNLAIAGLDNSYRELSSSVMALTSLQNSRQDNLATSTSQVSFNYPSTDDDFTTGCLYNISLTSSTTIHSLELTLIDAENDKPIDSKSSGLSATSTIATSTVDKINKIPWTVGKVTTGEYYLSLSKINGLEVDKKSAVFNIESSNSTSTVSSCR